MKIVTIYRYEIETPRGKVIGPYNAYRSFDDFETEEDEQKYHKFKDISNLLIRAHAGEYLVKRPEISSDIKREFSLDLLCGCEDLIKLFKWFHKFNSKIKDSGFNLVEYSVPEHAVFYGRSKKQLAFDINEVIEKKIIE